MLSIKSLVSETKNTSDITTDVSRKVAEQSTIIETIKNVTNSDNDNVSKMENHLATIKQSVDDVKVEAEKNMEISSRLTSIC